MNADQLRARQAPLKETYKANPASAVLTLPVEGTLAPELGCTVQAGGARVDAGLHPAAGGPEGTTSPVTLLLAGLVTCFGVTLQAVSTHMGIGIRGGRIKAEGDLDLRGTLGVDDRVPVGIREVRLNAVLDTDVSDAQLRDLLALVQKYAVVFQTLVRAVPISVSCQKGK